MIGRTDVGLGKHIAASTKELKEIEESAISELEDIPEIGHADSPHVSKATHPTLTSYRCYHIDCSFQTDDEGEYRRHGTARHLKNPLLFPSKFEIEKYGLQAQGKEWEI